MRYNYQISDRGTFEEFDYGMFSRLQTKLTLAKSPITSFVATFSNEGVYVFGDHAVSNVIQTVVLVTANEETCGG